VAAGLRLSGKLDALALEQALNAIVRRHEVLRTRFEIRDNERPVQVVDPEQVLELQHFDLTGLPEASRETEALTQAKDFACIPFDLARGPLLRVMLIKLAQEEHLLAASMHHIISDEWSTGVFLAELAWFYSGYVNRTPVELPPLRVQYADYAVWQQERLSGERLERLRIYWRSHLEGAPAHLELPLDRPRPAQPSFRGGDIALRLTPQMSEDLKRLARSARATSFMLLLSAFQLLLSRWSGQEQVVTGVPVANRTESEMEALIGFFVKYARAVRASYGRGEFSRFSEPYTRDHAQRVRASGTAV
jgi:hypothetical protein